MIGAVTKNKLQVIVDQIRFLQSQAQEILVRARDDAGLHRAECAFKKKPGTIYHLYRRANDSLYFSMLSPEEWGTPPHQYRGSYRLEPDMSWTPLEDVAEVDADGAVLDRLLASE